MPSICTQNIHPTIHTFSLQKFWLDYHLNRELRALNCTEANFSLCTAEARGTLSGIDKGTLSGIDKGTLSGIDKGTLSGIDKGTLRITKITPRTTLKIKRMLKEWDRDWFETKEEEASP
jgi:hypothetical protein